MMKSISILRIPAPVELRGPAIRLTGFVLLFLMAIFRVQAHDHIRQNAKLTLNMESVTVLAVMEAIESRTDFRFLYSEKDLDLQRKVTIRARKQSLETILATLFENTPITFRLLDRQIVLSAKPETVKGKAHIVPAAKADELPPQQLVSGTVTTTEGQPLPGVNIIVKDRGHGTMSDENGAWSIRAAVGEILVFSFVGFKTREYMVEQSNTLDVVMEEDVNTLDEVVVNAGYYKVKDRERTGSIARVSGEDIELQPIVSPLETLYGRMAGVEISQQDGMPGSAPIIRIRGRNSLRDDGNYPLYIIDGVPVNSKPIETDIGVRQGNLLMNNLDPLSTLNISDIESVEVLKDADATAIYGSRGANGVILITTRRGIGWNKKTQIEARWYTGIGQVERKMKLLNTEQYVEIREAAMTNAEKIPDGTNAPDIILWNTNRYTDWQEELLGGTASINNVNLSAYGGNSTTSFRINGSLQSQGNVFPEEMRNKRLTVGASISQRSENKKLGLDLKINYGIGLNESMAVNDIVNAAYKLLPNAPPLYNEDGSLHWEEWLLLNMDNPLAGKHSPVNTETHNIISNLMVSYKLFQGFIVKSSFGYTRMTNEILGKNFIDRLAPPLREGADHVMRKGFQKRLSWIIEPQITYGTTLGEGTLNTLVGVTFQKNESDRFGVVGTGFASESLVGDLRSAESYMITGVGSNEYKYNAIFGRIGYDYQKKYLINFTGRRDGSSRFGPGRRFSNFWAIGGAWIFTEEPFVKNYLPFLSFGKLRGSYGTTGSDNVGDYQYLDAYQSTDGPGGLYPTRLFNPDFVWEENRKLEAAIELGFFKDHINIGLSWYRNRSSNQLINYPLPAMTGFTSVTANSPATVQNTGWEMEVSTLNIQNKNLRWHTAFNISFSKNRLISFPNIEQSSYASLYMVGYPLETTPRFKFIGTNPETGFYEVEDVNQDGRYDQEDMIIRKTRGRQYYGGISNSISYKGFQCNFLIDFIKQKNHKGLPFTDGAPGVSGWYNNRSIQEYEAWKNGEMYIEDSPAFYSTYLIANRSDVLGWVDSSFIRLKTLSLSYDLPKIWLDNSGISALRIFISAQNLITITSYPGVNLESPPLIALPPLRMVTGGVQLTL
ncbi:SusC/RagA family TonB-linked outer membrane protein [Sinomicrobium soli]|uniref:SusC/RagA family TonB-linked outer membrane protein n=1 Tax=Sinomicrobium sp. N-1-3-6 TaxID=2219864 RepID=UPI000DCB7EC5|nr:SusC/RagA family TonB-linked outer membrane protein [Sinomicrobium sp. N-1-3-6]RAV27717.1 SusC/RagA family TonB-linked outer membrane protein [Sinomicrobium sp. N-1-3-6]